MEKFFDAHTHLQMMENLSEEMDKAREKGVEYFICNSTSPADWDSVLAISKKYKGVYVCFGVHPHYVENLPADWLEKLEGMLNLDKKIMVGEIGLDKKKTNLEFQKKVFREQLILANKLKRPAHIHCVGCWGMLLGVFEDLKKDDLMPPKILLHSHHGSKELIPELMKKYNAYFSYSSIFVPMEHPKVQACLKSTPLDRLLIESDAPDLTPSPADIPDLMKKMGVITGHSVADLKKAIYKNAKEFVNG